MSEVQPAQPGAEEDEVKVDMGCPNWMVTFGDAMSLLLCFFVLLLTFSTTDEHQLLETVGFIKGALSPVAAEEIQAQDEVSTERVTAAGAKSVQGDYHEREVSAEELSPVALNSYEFNYRRLKLRRRLEQLGFEHFVSLDRLDEGISMRTQTDMLFRPGTAIFQPDRLSLAEGFATLVTGVGNEIRLSALISAPQVNAAGHFTREWGLIIRRLNALARLLENKFEVNPDRISFSVTMVPAKEGDTVEMLLMEKRGVKEIDQEELTQELLKQLQDRKG